MIHKVDFDYEKAYNDLVEELIYLPCEVSQNEKVSKVIKLALDMPEMDRYKLPPRFKYLTEEG